MLLAIAPDVFHWVKFRRIRRQELQFNRPTLRGDKLSHQPTAMNRQTVPNESQSTADVTLQMFQKLDDLRRLDAAGKKPKVKIPDGNARDGRKTFPVERILQYRSLPARGPGANPVRPLAQAALVHAHYGSPLLERFFFISGQRTRFHRRIAGSLRWVARPTGRWQLQPSERKIRHTCPG